jgi:plastocyanin
MRSPHRCCAYLLHDHHSRARDNDPDRHGNLEIKPAEAAARAGDTIEWINKDVFAHTATARNGDFDVTLPPNQTVSFVLKKAGAVGYYCRFHPNMKALLKIEP